MNHNPCEIITNRSHKKYYEKEQSYNDLTVFYSGKENCEPGHLYSGIREHYLIHYIIAGQGTLELNEQSYQLNKNQGFLCPANIKITYQADYKNPWSYYWIGFSGINAYNYLKKTGLTEVRPIYYCHDNNDIYNCMKEIHETDKAQTSIDFYLTSLIYKLFFYLSQYNNKDINEENKDDIQKIHLKKSIKFIKQNYSHNISVEDIANNTGVSRKYLCSIFKETVGIPTQKYLIEYRVKKACELLKNSGLTITEVAFSVGYNNSLVFSKAFKREMGISPSQYRK